MAATEESVSVPISISAAQSDDKKLSDVQVIEADLATTEELEVDQEVCAIEPPRKAKRQKE